MGQGFAVNRHTLQLGGACWSDHNYQIAKGEKHA
jgi:hypothetical protein